MIKCIGKIKREKLFREYSMKSISRIKRKRSFEKRSDSKLFFNDYCNEMFERIDLIKNTFNDGLALGFRNIEFTKAKNKLKTSEGVDIKLSELELVYSKKKALLEEEVIILSAVSSALAKVSAPPICA